MKTTNKPPAENQDMPRRDDKLANLTAEDGAMLLSWLESKSLDEVKDLAAKPRPEGLDLHVSRSTIGRFHTKARCAALFEDQQHSTEIASEMMQQATTRDPRPSPYKPITFRFLEERAFHEALAPNGTPADHRAIANFVLRLASYQLKEKHYQLARERFEYKAAREALKKLPQLNKIHGTPQIDDEEKINKIRMEMFGCIAE